MKTIHSPASIKIRKKKTSTRYKQLFLDYLDPCASRREPQLNVLKLIHNIDRK